MKKLHFEENDQSRRKFLVRATSILGTIGATFTSWPFISSMLPDARAEASGANVQVDLKRILPGFQTTVVWRKKPVWIMHRTEEMLKHLENQNLLKRLRDPLSQVKSQQPNYAENKTRSINPEYFIALGICTHLGCNPKFRPTFGKTEFSASWHGGYYCPCHGSLFDLAGRVYKNVPAPTNLVIPPYRFVTPTEIEIGAHHKQMS